MKWKKVFLKEKVSEANWLSLFTEPLPLLAEFDSNTTYCVYICVYNGEWKTWCYFEKASKSLSVMSGGTSKEMLCILIRWCITHQGIFGLCLCFIGWLPHINSPQLLEIRVSDLWKRMPMVMKRRLAQCGHIREALPQNQIPVRVENPPSCTM